MPRKNNKGSLRKRVSVPVASPPRETKETAVVHIAVEGSREEPAYFQKLIEAYGGTLSQEEDKSKMSFYLNISGDTFEIHILPSEYKTNNPKSIIDCLAGPSYISGDTCWAVFDVDHYGDDFLTKILKDAKTQEIQVAISNPCFEVWLHLHSNDIDELKELCTERQDQRPKSMKQRCSYLYAEVDSVKFKRHVRLATDRAKTNEAERKEVYPNCPGTDVYKVVEDIWSKLRIEF